MQSKKLLILALATFFIIGCKGRQPEDAQTAIAQDTASSVPDTADSDGDNNRLATISAPAPTTVLRDIYNEEIQDAETIQLKDGRYVSYWYGYPFASGSKKYFVGFAEATGPSEIEYPAYENKVTVSHATYELVDGKWKLNKAQNAVGSFGSYNKPPSPESEKKADLFVSKSGKLFLSIPTFQTATAGIRLSSFELFAFSEKETSWQYLGQIEAGSDNSAGCAQDSESSSPIKCATSTASLEFMDIDNQAWPILKVQMQGTSIGDDGKVLTLSTADFIEYRYDNKSSSYKK
jgi:hypothetical protein